MAGESVDPSALSGPRQRMEDSWVLIRALLRGTTAMRAARETFLPKHPAETQTAYNQRLEKADLLNVFGEAVADIAGRPFATTVAPAETAPDDIKALATDIDLLGNSLHVFGAQLHTDAVAFGFGGFLVDYTDTSASTPATLADQRQSGARPYWVRYAPENIIAVHSTHGENQRPALSHVRLFETEIRVDAQTFKEILVERVRVFNAADGKVQLFVYERETEAGGKSAATEVMPGQSASSGSAWVQKSTKDLSIKRIPFVPLALGMRIGSPLSYEVIPPLNDLANKNKRHFQLSSDHQNIVTYCCFPMLQVQGPPPKTQIDPTTGEPKPFEIGPHVVLTSESGMGWSWVEPTGSGISAAERALDRLEYDMRLLGLQPLIRSVGVASASEVVTRESRSASPAARMARATKDALEQGLSLTAEWKGLEAGNMDLSVTMDTDFGIDADDAVALNAILKLHERGQLSNETVRAEYARRRVLGDQFDEQKERDRLREGDQFPVARSEAPPMNSRGGSA